VVKTLRLYQRLGQALALKGNIRVLTVEAMVTAMFYGMLFVIWQPFVLTLGASMTVLGGLSATLGLLGSFSSPIWGRLSDRVGRKPLLILSNVLKACALVFCIIANTWFLLIPYVIFMGLSASYRQYNPAGASVVAESVKRSERGVAYSVLMFSSQVTTAIVAPLGGFLAMIYGFVPIFYACNGDRHSLCSPHNCFCSRNLGGKTASWSDIRKQELVEGSSRDVLARVSPEGFLCCDGC
jgi:MFS family permease